MPDGLRFDASSRTLSGTPIMPTATSLTYTVTDANGASVSTTFTVTIAGRDHLNAQLHDKILSRFTQVMATNTNISVENRVDAVFSGAPQAGYQLDGQTVQLDGTMVKKLPTYAKSLQDGTMDWKKMLSQSSFVLPLNATDGGAGNAGLTVWGSGDYTKLRGKSMKGANLDWNGDVTGFQLGIDGRLGIDGHSDDLLTGGLVSFSKGSAKYAQDNIGGTYKHTTISIHPYVAWT